jgi:hypothetical protein
MGIERVDGSASKLRQLVEEIYDNLGEEIPREFENWPVRVVQADLDYDPGEQSKNKSFKYDQKDRQVLTEVTLDRVLEFTKNRELYSEILEGLNNWMEGSEHHLDNFLGQVIQANPNEFDEDFVTESISSFVKDIAGGDYQWNSEIWLEAIFFEPDELQIDDELTLRKPTEEDLEGPVRGRDVRDISRVPSLILDINTITYSHREIRQRANEIASVLRLFDLGSVGITQIDFNPQTFLQTPAKGIVGNTGDSVTPFRFTVYDSQKKNLNQFIKTLLPVVRHVKNEDVDPNIAIAVDRYEKAVTEKGRMESILTSGFMVLEALFVKDDERGELTYRLTKRAGKFLGIFDFEPIKVQNKLKSFYDIRSRYLHGASIDEDGLRSKTEDVMNYARRALVAFLLLNEDGYDKGDIISKIENSFLKVEAYEAFKEEVQEITGDLIT